MRHPLRPALTAAIAALLPLFAPIATAACKLKQLAELTTSSHGQPLVPISIDGHAATILVDTGAGKSMIWRKAAEALNLPITPVNGEVYGVGGADTLGIVHVHDLGLAGFVVHNLNIVATGRLGSEQMVGLLGEDFLSKFDIEFDLSKNAIRLFQPEDCKGDQVVYWANAYSVLDLVRPAQADSGAMGMGTRQMIDPGWVIAHVSLNGEDALAMFDTGAGVSTVSPSLVRNRRIQSQTVPIEEGTERGIAGKAVPTEVASFAVLSVGQESLQNARLRIADLWGGTKAVETGSMIARAQWAPADMLIGADFFRAHRVYIARGQKKMYFTYQGGPVFLLSPRRPPPAPATTAPPASSPASASASVAAPPETPKN